MHVCFDAHVDLLTEISGFHIISSSSWEKVDLP